jgi:hypothetical protein
MRFASIFLAAVQTALVVAARVPDIKRDDSQINGASTSSSSCILLELTIMTSDVTVLQYAATLGRLFLACAVLCFLTLRAEHLENAFYTEGLNKYNAAAFSAAGFPDWSVMLTVRERFPR